MELQIPQSFKVQWLNTTLKFIKDDTQLVKDYPQMPSSHVEYLHNLIWQRKNDVGLGFKSLYSPVWEAMKIYSIKYKFKIVVKKSEDGMSGHLVMEKIPKTGEPDINMKNDENIDKKNNDENKEKENETIQNYEDPKTSQTEAVKCKQPEPRPLKKTKTKKPIPQMSKGLKTFLENQEILDSLSPLFIKTTLKSILDFITDELSASKIFSNLAPIESRFLMNFLTVYQRRNDLEVLLSPACNEILTEISNCFDDFSKTCCLDISSVGINSNTNKREIKYTKVPVFPSKKKSKLKQNSIQTNPTKTTSPNNKSKLDNVHSISNEDNITLKENSIQTKSTKTTSPNNKSKLDNVHSISKENNITLKENSIQTNSTKTTSPNNKSKLDNVHSISKENNITLKENSIQTKPIKTISANNKSKLINVDSINNIMLEKNVSKDTKKSKSINKTNILQNNTISKNRHANSEPIDKVIETIDNNVIEALSTFVKKADVKPKTSTDMKDTSLNKSILLPKKSICFTKEGTPSTAHTPSIRVDKKSPRMSILRDMTVPIKSDKAVKMMQLMGWKGGPLGLRGCGITEPIIPIPNFNARGLGHVPVKKSDKESNKETKEYIRSEIVNKMLKMIDNDIKTCVIKLQNQLNKKEIKFWKLTLEAINNRMNLGTCIERRLEIKDKMISNVDITFNMDFVDINRKIVITKKSKTEVDVNQNTKRKTNSEEIDNAITFKTIVLKSILALIKSEDNEIVIQFSEELTAKNINYSTIMIQLINERQHFQQKNCPVVGELGSKVLEAIGDIILSVVIYESERYIVIRKKHPKSNINQDITKTVVNKAESDENNNSIFDNVRVPLKNKKKVKLLNALYKYEMEDTEEFKENRWYNTVDRSLLEAEQTSKVINETQKEIIHKNYKNITRTIINDQYNHGGVSVNKV